MAKNKFKLFSIFLLMGVLLIGIASASYSSEFNSIQKDLGNSLGSETGSEIGSERGDGFESEFGQEKELTKEELQKEINIEKDVKNILGTSYKIKEHKWWDILKIWTEDIVQEITLEDNSFECGNDCYAIVEVTNNKPTPLIDEVLWKRDFGDGRGFVDYKGFSNWRVLVYDEVIDYDYSCSVEERFDSVNETSYNETSCEQIVIGSHYDWIKYDYNKDYEGTYKIKLMGSKKDNVIYDWIIKTNGQLTSEWAVWGAVIGVGGVEASVTLNSPADDSIQYTPTVTLNASANVTGGAYLVNASLNQSVNGGAWQVVNTSDFPTIMGGEGLVSYYKLDETSGVVVDSLGINNGTNNGATVNVAGKINTAYDFDGINDRIEQVAKVNYGDFTLSSWINADVLNTEYHTIYGMREAGDEIPLMQFRFNANKLGVEVRSNTGKDHTYSYSTTSLNTGQWYHAVLVYSGTTFTIYIDGNVYHTVSYTGGTWNDVDKYWIGAGYGLGTPEYFFNGKIDEVGIWSRALTPTEIENLYNSGAGSRPFTTTTTTTFTNTYSQGDNILWNMKFCDSDGDCGQAVSNYRFTIDSIAPTIDANLTEDILYAWGNNMTVNYNITDTNLDFCYYTYAGKFPSYVNCSGESFNFTTEENYTNITIHAVDQANNRENRTLNFSLDSSAPTIALNSPTSLIDYGRVNQTLQLNFTATDDNLDKVWYGYESYVPTFANLSTSDIHTFSDTVNLLRVNYTSGTQKIEYFNVPDCDTIKINRSMGGSVRYFWCSNGSYIGSVEWSVYPGDGFNSIDGNNIITGMTSGIYNLSNITLSTKKNVTIYANDTAGNLATEVFGWDYKVFENERVYNNETFETKDETFTINITSDKVSKVWLNYNGLDYETNNINPYNVTINIPPTQANTNRTFYWKFLYNNSENITSKIDEHLVKTFKLNWTGDKQLIKFEIRDEFDNSLINNTDLRLLGEYYIDGDGYTKILDEFKTADGSYDFRSTPNIESVRIQGEAFYQAIGYQPRYYFFDDEVFTNSSLTTKTFYLSLYTDGILVRYKIVDSAANPIKNVKISAKKVIGQQKILVEQVLTDDEGEASLFLDPNYYHDIIIEKETCQTITKNRRITSSEQTMEVLNCNLEPDEPSLPLVTFNKVSFKFLPNTIPTNAQGNYALSLETKDKNCELTKSEFVLTYNGNVLDTQTKLNDCGDTFNSIVNTSTINGYLVVKGTVWKDDLSMTESKSYYIYDDSGLIYNESSIADILENFKNNTFGDKLGLSEKSRILITFLILFGIISALSISDRGMKDSVPIILIVSNLYLWAMSYIGFLTLPADLVSIKVIQQYGVAVLTSILSFFGYHIGKGR